MEKCKSITCLYNFDCDCELSLHEDNCDDYEYNPQWEQRGKSEIKIFDKKSDQICIEFPLVKKCKKCGGNFISKEFHIQDNWEDQERFGIFQCQKCGDEISMDMFIIFPLRTCDNCPYTIHCNNCSKNRTIVIPSEEWTIVY